MARYTLAQLPQWALKVEKVANAVVKQATNDLLNSIEIGPSITRTGARRVGTIPRDLGALAASLQSSLYGSTALTGPESYVFIIGAMKAGDRVTFAWGGAVAPYAEAVHYGANGVAGTFWVDIAANKWSTVFVPGAVEKARQELGL